jgi:hypothetical protein
MIADRVYILGKEDKQESYTMEVISPDKFVGYIKLEGKKQLIHAMTSIKPRPYLKSYSYTTYDIFLIYCNERIPN